MNASNHPEKQCLEDYALGKLPEIEATDVARHLTQCPECESTIAALDVKSDTLVSGLRKKPVEPYSNEAELKQAAAKIADLPQRTSPHATTPSEPSEKVSTKAPVKLGPYQLLAKLGEGGMGAVFKARHEHLEKIVAIKVLPKKAMQDPAAVARFRREMKAVGALHHPNIVGAHDAGEQQGVHFLVMEYVAGSDLSSLIKKSGPVTIEQAISYTLQAAKGLAFAHSKNIVHRDIKPANLLVDAEGTVKILDMGLARLDDGGDANREANQGLTQTGQVMGTVDYMAPEQAFDTHRADAKADVYSLGCTLYRILTGENAYRGETVVQKILAHREQPIPSLVKSCPTTPAALEALYQRMMAKRPEERPTMAEVATELERIADPQAAPAIIIDVAKKPAVVASLAPHAATAAKPQPKAELRTSVKGGRSKPPVQLVAAGLGGCALILLGVIFIIRDKEGNEIARVKAPDGSSITITAKPEPSGSVVSSSIPPEVHAFGSPKAPIRSPGTPPESFAKSPKFTNALGMEFSFVPKGKSWLGGGGGKPGTQIYEQPYDFYLGTYEVTQEEWRKVMGYNPSRFVHAADNRSEKDLVKDIPEAELNRFPVEYVNGFECTKFLELLNESAKESGWSYRLPTVAEWEYACRGGPLTDPTESAFDYYFDQPTNRLLPTQLNSALPPDLRRTCRVGLYAPNGLGLFDMHGNVSEWCDDVLEPVPPQKNTQRRRKGGNWFHKGEEFKASALELTEQWYRFNNVGLRVARVPVAVSPSPPTGNYALRFDGLHSFVAVPSIGLQTSQQWTFEATIVCERQGCLFWLYGDNSWFAVDFMLGEDGGAILKASGTDRGNEVVEASIPLGKPVPIAVVVHADRVELFVDGKRAVDATRGTHTDKRNDVAGPGRFYLGANSSERTIDRRFCGTIDEMRVSKSARYDADYAVVPRLDADADTLALYHFDEGVGDVLRDASRSGHDGKITRAEWIRADAAPTTPVSRGGEASVVKQPGDQDRAVAEWALGLGATLAVITPDRPEGKYVWQVSKVEELPKTPFYLSRFTVNPASCPDPKKFGDEAVERLLGLEQLREASFYEAAVTDVGAAKLAQIPTLEYVLLRGLKGVSDDSVLSVLKLPKLQTLNVGGTAVTDRILSVAAECPKLTQLELIGCPNITDAGLEDFKKARPDCRVIRSLKDFQ